MREAASILESAVQQEAIATELAPELAPEPTPEPAPEPALDSTAVPESDLDEAEHASDAAFEAASTPLPNGTLTTSDAVAEAASTPLPNGTMATSPALASSAAEDEVHLISTEPLSDIKMEDEPEAALPSSNSNFTNHTQHMPSSLVSPPDSTHNDGGATSPRSVQGAGMTPPATSSSSRRSSRRLSHAAKPAAPPRITPESGPARRGSVASRAAESERASASPMTPAPGGAAEENKTAGKARKKSRPSSEVVADRESWELIQQLRMEERGLRRRGKA